MELIGLRQDIDRLELRFSQLAAAFDKTEYWDQEGSNSAIDWIRFNCRMTSTAAADRLAVGKQLDQMAQSQQAVNEFYGDEEEMVMDYAIAVNAEARELERAGADVIQLDEPWLRNDPDAAKRVAVKAINRALEGLKVPTIVHLCFGYAALVPGETKPVGYSFLPQLADSTAQQISIEAAQPKLDLGVLADLAPKKVLLGVIDLNDPKAETAQVVAERIRAGLKFVAPDKLIPAPDCGMKYLPRAVAFAKLKALSEGAAIVRKEL